MNTTYIIEGENINIIVEQYDSELTEKNESRLIQYMNNINDTKEETGC